MNEFLGGFCLGFLWLPLLFVVWAFKRAFTSSLDLGD